MTIQIKDEISLTSEEYMKYYEEYKNYCMHLGVTPPTFEQYVRRKLLETNTNEGTQLLLG